MRSTVDARLHALNIVLPNPAPPAAHYLPYIQVEDLVYISGQLPFEDGQIAYVGKVGDVLGIEQGQQAARLAAMHLLAQMREVCGGDLERVKKCIRLCGYVCSTEAFTEHPLVLNGASDLICDVLGEKKGLHARAAVGVNSLPLGAAVEVEGIFQVE